MQKFKKRGLSACLNLCIGFADNGQPQGLSLRTVAIDISRILCRCRGIGASRSPHPTSRTNKIVEFIIYPRVLQQSNILYFPRFGIILLFEKEKQTRGFTPRPRNAVQQYIVRGSQSVARHIRPQTRWSLNECGLVRLASQAVQPSQNIVANIASLHPPPAALR